MGFLFRVYINELAKGNPFVVVPTAIVAVAASVGPFYEGLSTGDPWAIGLVTLILLGIAVVLTVAIIDRRSDPERKKKRRRRPASKR